MSQIERSRSHLALDPRSRHLPATPADGFAVGWSEPLAEALHRLTTEQFTIAIDALGDPSVEIGIATAATLRSVSKIAAVLRLVRGSIGDEAYRTELAILRDAETQLSALLVGQPELRALDQLRARYSSVIEPSAFLALRTQLLQRHQVHRLQALAQSERLQDTMHRLERARARFAAWPIDDGNNARMYGREPVPDSFDAVGPGLERTYRRGRKHWQASRDGVGTKTFSKWHRECRHLGNQLEVLQASWPEVIAATASAARRLEAVLAEDSALSALEAIVTGEGSFALDEPERALLRSIVANSRAELGHIADVLGARLYIEPTRQFVARMEAYWQARGA